MNFKCPDWIYDSFKGPEVRVTSGPYGYLYAIPNSQQGGYDFYDQQGDSVRFPNVHKILNSIGTCQVRTCPYPNPSLAAKYPHDRIKVYRDNRTGELLFAIDFTAVDGGVQYFDKTGKRVHRSPQWGWERIPSKRLSIESNFQKGLQRLC